MTWMLSFRFVPVMLLATTGVLGGQTVERDVPYGADPQQRLDVIIKEQKAEIQRQNRQLQDTIDELTRARIGRKAKALTLALAIILFIFQDAILRTALRLLASDNYFLLLGVKMAIIFSLAPINRAIEHHLLKNVMRKQRLSAALAASAAVPLPHQAGI
jgi:hypothetical protein